MVYHHSDRLSEVVVQIAIVVVEDFVLAVNMLYAHVTSQSQSTFGVDHPSRLFQIGHA